MVQYYNMSNFGGGTGIISFWQSLSELTKYMFGYMLVGIIFIIPLIYMIKNGEETNRAMHVASLYATLMALFLYLGRIINRGETIYVFALVYIITATIRWYHKD